MVDRIGEWYRRNRVLVWAVYITLVVTAVILLSGCRDTGNKKPEPSPGPPVQTPSSYSMNYVFTPTCGTAEV